MRAQIAGCACADSGRGRWGKSSDSDQICNQGPIRGLVRESQPRARSAESDACTGVITKPRNHKTPAISAPFAQTRHPFPLMHQIGNQGPTRESVHESGTGTAERARARIDVQPDNGRITRSCTPARHRYPRLPLDWIRYQEPICESVHESQPWARSTESGVHRGIIQNPGTARLPAVRCMEAAQTASPGADYILNQSPIRESVLESGTSTAEEARARISAQQGNGGTMRICIIPYSHSASPSASFPGLNPQSGTEPRISPPHGE